MATDKLVQLDPAKVDASENAARFALLKHRVDRLAENISEVGKVRVPVEVVKLDKPVNGYSHKLISGFIRHAAVAQLNKAGAGLKLPALEVETPASDLDRISLQVGENMERENMSPMDRAVAMQAMLDAGASRDDVAKRFATPGGRKAQAVQPLSPSAIRMHLFLLELPKSIQTKVHDGRLPLFTAWQLHDVEEGQREAVLERAEAKRLAAIDADEKLSKRLEAGAETEAAKAAKQAEKQAKIDKLKAAHEAADAAYQAALTAHQKATDDDKAAKMVGPLEQAHGKPFAELPDEIRKQFAEQRGAAKAALRAAEVELGKARRAQDKAERAYKAAVTPKAKPEAPAEPTPTKKVARPTPADVQKAAKESGAAKKTAAPKQLDIKAVRDAVKELEKSGDKKVMAIAKVFGRIISGELTPGEAIREFAKVK